MLIISRRKLLRTLAWLGVLILLGAAFTALGMLDAWLIHRFIPDEVYENPWFWQYYNQRPAFAPAPEGYSIYVDLDTMILTLYKDGAEHKTYPCSGGKKSTPSPLGDWKTTHEGDWGEGFGGSWIAINCPWGKFGIHGTVEPWTIGHTNASHGCIRMLNSDVAELKKIINYGTPIHIKYDGIPFRGMKDGMYGSDVLELQQKLKELGYLAFAPDGRFGAGTTAAVKKLQKDNGMYADGIAGWGTMDLLDRLLTD